MKLFLFLILMVITLVNRVNAQPNFAPTVSITTSGNSLEVDKNALVTATSGIPTGVLKA